MRYLIEAKTATQQRQLENFIKSQQSADCKVVDKYDPIVQLTERVEKMGAAMREFKSSGVTWDVFRTYLHGLGISYSDIDGVMNPAEEFFKKIGIISK